MPSIAGETPLQQATREVRAQFNSSLGNTPMDVDAWAYYQKAFKKTLDYAINRYGAPIWQEPNRTYVLQQVALIARLARYYAMKDGNSQQISEQHVSDAIDIGIEQARFECAVAAPGLSCQGYTGRIQ